MRKGAFRNLARRAVLVVVSALLVGGIGALAAEKRAKHDFQGRPEINEGKAKGYFIFKADGDWHLVWATPEKKHKFSGTVTTDGTFEKFARVGAEKSDVMKQTAPNRITIDATAAGGKDGIRFKLGPNSKTITFDLMYDGKPAPLDMIKIGPKKGHPSKSTVTFTDVATK